MRSFGSAMAPIIDMISIVYTSQKTKKTHELVKRNNSVHFSQNKTRMKPSNGKIVYTSQTTFPTCSFAKRPDPTNLLKYRTDRCNSESAPRMS